MGCDFETVLCIISVERVVMSGGVSLNIAGNLHLKAL